MEMTSRQRLRTAIARGVPDRMPVTTHHLMKYFLDHYLDGATNLEFFDRFGLDAILWTCPYRSDAATSGEAPRGGSGRPARSGTPTDNWRIEQDEIPGQEFPTLRYRFVTPKGTLSLVVQSNEYTSWATERIIKNPADIDLLGEFMPAPACDVEAVNRSAEEFGERGIIRGHICGFDIHGQGGCWQDAACLVGIEKLIMATYDDPAWVHELLGIMLRVKLSFARSLAGAKFDILETGGGDASSTVISPRIFDDFVAPYDSQVIAAAHEAGQKIVYHTCGGMMPLLERIADMGPDAIETLTPSDMGGDIRLAEAKRRIGDRTCMIGGFDQFHDFLGCTPADTRAAVRRCFEEAGAGGGFILSPSDHFFDADLGLIAAYADEARRCTYS